MQDYYNKRYSNDSSIKIRNNERVLTDGDVLLRESIMLTNMRSGFSILNIGGNDNTELCNKFEEFNNLDISVVDISDEAIKIGLRKYPKINFIHEDAEKYVSKNSKYDLIISLRTLHSPKINAKKVISNIKQSLKHDSYVIISIPTGYLKDDFTIKKGLYIDGAWDVHFANKKKEELIKALSKESFSIVDIKEGKIETFIISYLS